MLHIRPMTAADVPMAMVLKTEAGWNQVKSDWCRFLDMQPDGCFVAELDGEPVGTTVACIFGDVAWIAMVLVARRVRGRGIGTALVRYAIEFLDRAGVPTVRLDATPLGRPIYEKLGFAAEYPLARYEGVLGEVVQDDNLRDRPALVRMAVQQDVERIVELDREVTGTSRERFFTRLFRDLPDALRVVEDSGGMVGHCAIRPGSGAVQIGPCIGMFQAGAALFADAARRLHGKRALVDVPARHEQMTRITEQAGFRVQRHLVRMRRGPVVREDAARLLASSGPELG